MLEVNKPFVNKIGGVYYKIADGENIKVPCDEV